MKDSFSTAQCVFCQSEGGTILWQEPLLRVVRAEEAGYAGFCRIILQRHVGEMTDLAPAERLRVMTVVFAVEHVLRNLMSPDKINLASLGNQTPHLHWHVIARFQADRHFPDAVWSAPKRVAKQPAQVSDAELTQALHTALQSDER